jgi:hypothetical protein
MWWRRAVYPIIVDRTTLQHRYRCAAGWLYSPSPGIAGRSALDRSAPRKSITLELVSYLGETLVEIAFVDVHDEQAAWLLQNGTPGQETGVTTWGYHRSMLMVFPRFG